MPENNSATQKKSRRFTISVWLLAIVLVAGNIFVFCGPAYKAPTRPSYSNYTYKQWQKTRPGNLAECIAALDTLVSDSAKKYYASLPEAYATLKMKSAMGGQVYGNWINNVNVVQQNPANGLLQRWFEKNNCRQTDLMQKVIWQSFRRHIVQQPWDEKAIIDSLNRRFPAKKDFLSNYQIDYTMMYDLDDSIETAYQVRYWPLNTVVYESTFSGAGGFKKKVDFTMEGVIVDRDTINRKVLVRISSLKVNNKSRSTYQSGNDATTLEVGKTFWRNLRYMYRKNETYPFYY